MMPGIVPVAAALLLCRNREFSQVGVWLHGYSLQDIQPDCRINELSGSMPGQNQLLEKLAASPDEKLRDWMRRLGYSDSPVLVSMWPCHLLLAGAPPPPAPCGHRAPQPGP